MSSKARLVLLLSGLFFVITCQAAEATCSNLAFLATTGTDRAQLQWAVVERVVDGDTLKLQDGRKVRLIGVNTPELGRDGKPNQPLAREAKQFVERFLAKSGSRRIQLLPGVQPRDRHGRTLAHIFDARGLSLEAALLEHGLAYHVAVPPNLRMASCFADIENRAEYRKIGVWQPQTFTREKPQGGYQRITGQVAAVSFHKAWWVSFEDKRLQNFVAVIYPEGQQYTSRKAIQNWAGKMVTVEGWVYSARYQGRQQWRLKLETPYAWTVHP